MPLTVPIDLLSDTPRAEWVHIPCDPSDRTKGTVRVLLQELPKNEFSRLLGLWRGKKEAEGEIGDAIKARLEDLKDSLLRYGTAADEFVGVSVEAAEARRLIEDEIVAKCVIAHKSRDCVVVARKGLEGKAREKAKEILSALGLSGDEVAKALHEGQTEVKHQPQHWEHKSGQRPGVGPRTVRYYRAAGPVFFMHLLMACLNFHDCKIRTPAEIWEEYEKRKAEREKAEREAKEKAEAAAKAEAEGAPPEEETEASPELDPPTPESETP